MILRQGAPGLHEIRESPAGAEGLSPWRDGAAAGLARAAGCRCAPSRAVVNENCLVDDSRDLPRSGRGAKTLALRALPAGLRRTRMRDAMKDAGCTTLPRNGGGQAAGGRQEGAHRHLAAHDPGGDRSATSVSKPLSSAIS